MSKNFCFTWNNYTDENQEYCRQTLSQPDVVYATFGREVGDETHTPHLQGYIQFTRPRRITQIIALFRGAHVEKCKGSPLQNKVYCQKGNDFEEFGNFDNCTYQGKRSDIDAVKDFIINSDEYPSDRILCNEFTSLWLRYGRRIRELRDMLRTPAPLEVGPYRTGWQSVLRDRLESPPDDRKIYFVVDEAGGHGKSWFCRKFISEHEDISQILSVGKRDDLAYAIDETKSVFLFDIPRNNMQYLQYGILESLKNRIVFSSKYQSTTKRLLSIPHVVVFCNEEPDRSALTRDRYNVMRVVTL